MWLYFAFSSNYIFRKEALEFIDIISLIPRPHPAFVAALQASLVGTWEWDYKHYEPYMVARGFPYHGMCFTVDSAGP